LRIFAIRFSANIFRNTFPVSDFCQRHFFFNDFYKTQKKNGLEFYTKIATEIGNAKCGLTFRRYPTVANPANCVLSAKIMFLREERRTT
jgi:hypothetical protein